MARKRKVEATRLDEVDRTMYSTFCSAANSLSQLYTQAMNQQKIVFQAGERHGMEKVYQWILRQHEEGSRVNAVDIVNHIQNELNYSGEDPPTSPRVQFPHQHSQPTIQFPSSGVLQPSTGGTFAQGTVGLAPRPSHSDQTKNSVFSNALSSPVRRSLQHYHLTQGGASNGARNPDNDINSPAISRESNSSSANDSSMDMHSDSPSHAPY